MTEDFENLANLDRLVHEPARLSILTALAACQSADFHFIERLTGMSSGNLSSHLTKLEAAALIEIKKQFVGKRPNTRVTITRKGLAAVQNHWQRLDELRKNTQDWEPGEPV